MKRERRRGGKRCGRKSTRKRRERIKIGQKRKVEERDKEKGDEDEEVKE